MVTAVAAQAAGGSRCPDVSAGGGERLVALSEPRAAVQRSRGRRCGPGEGAEAAVQLVLTAKHGLRMGCRLFHTAELQKGVSFKKIIIRTIFFYW